MDPGLATVVGMSIAYIASFIGLGLAWRAWHRRVEDGTGPDDPPVSPNRTDRSGVEEPGGRP
jgi:hypothetical protein